MERPAPRMVGLLESALYCDDLERAATFYERVLGLARLRGDARIQPLAVPGGQTLLLFRRGASTAPIATPGGVVPPHDGAGPVHLAFAVPAGALDAWEARLAEHGVTVESRVSWRTGDRSLYFRDPDGHSVELATPGLWRGAGTAQRPGGGSSAGA